MSHRQVVSLPNFTAWYAATGIIPLCWDFCFGENICSSMQKRVKISFWVVSCCKLAHTMIKLKLIFCSQYPLPIWFSNTSFTVHPCPILSIWYESLNSRFKSYQLSKFATSKICMTCTTWHTPYKCYLNETRYHHLNDLYDWQDPDTVFNEMQFHHFARLLWLAPLCRALDHACIPRKAPTGSSCAGPTTWIAA